MGVPFSATVVLSLDQLGHRRQALGVSVPITGAPLSVRCVRPPLPFHRLLHGPAKARAPGGRRFPQTQDTQTLLGHGKGKAEPSAPQRAACPREAGLEAGLGGRRLLPRGSLSAWAGGRATTELISTVRGPGLGPSPVGSPLSLLKPLLHN